MPFVADPQGNITAKLTIPASVPAGSKLVTFTGSGGSTASAVFTGQGLLEANTYQETITRMLQTQAAIDVNAAGRSRTDPLAQTFSLDKAIQATAVQLFITAKGTTPIQVQIRETQVGFPTSAVLAETQLTPSAITLNQWNSFVFPQPLVLLPQTEYAIVVLCNDADGAVAIAELGKYDTNNDRWVTNQPYQVGVLLSSSNASTWTAHQDKDLAFKLMAAQYTQAEKVIGLGNAAVSGATDLIVLSPMIQPATGADGSVVLSFPDGSSITASDKQVISLSSAVTGNIGVSAKVRSTSDLSAALAPGMQIIQGVVSTSAEYITRAIDADAAGCTVKIIYDAVIPPGASVTVAVSGVDSGDTYASATQVGSAKALGDGLYEYNYQKTGVLEAKVRVKLTLSGNVSARPKVKNLRVSVI